MQVFLFFTEKKYIKHWKAKNFSHNYPYEHTFFIKKKRRQYNRCEGGKTYIIRNIPAIYNKV